MINYAPRPGSAAAATVEYLRKKGGAARSAEIAEAIGIEAKNVMGALAAAVANGVLVACDVNAPGAPPQKEYRLSGGGKPMQWREPKPARAPVAAEAAPPAEKPARKARKPRKAPKPAPAHPRGASRPKVTGRLLRAAAEGRDKAAKRLPVAAVPWKAEQPSGGFRCGIFNDGSLELVFGNGEFISLSPADTRTLFDYLDKTLQVAA